MKENKPKGDVIRVECKAARQINFFLTSNYFENVNVRTRWGGDQELSGEESRPHLTLIETAGKKRDRLSHR